MGNIWTLITGLNDLALVVQAQGHLRQAQALFEEGLSEASHQGARSLGYIARIEAGLANVLYEQNELEEASRLLADAITHTRQWPNPNHLAYAYTFQSRVRLAQGDLQGARASIVEADSIRRSVALTRLNRRLVEANLIRVWLALQAAGSSLEPGNPIQEWTEVLLDEWQIELAGMAGNPAAFMEESAQTAALGLARVWLTTARAEEALPLLERVFQSARAAGHLGGMIGSLILSAIAQHGRTAIPKGQVHPALATLEEALSLAEPCGYLRIFLDEGQPVQMLLAQWLAYTENNRLHSYAVRLLSHFEIEPDSAPPDQKMVSSAGNPIEPLSRRELEVLHLLALGKTNQEIASQLVIALGTVKAQTASIYRKLDATNRTEAVARARQMGILP
jgi:LuxR family maltose regulon positive regulatory protein